MHQNLMMKGKLSLFFFIVFQLCITLNNIEHVTAYLKNLEHELEWEKVADSMGSAHESKEIQQQVLTTLHRLTRNCSSDINLKSRLLITEIVDRMKMDMTKKMEILTTNWKALSVSAVIRFLKKHFGPFSLWIIGKPRS